jgi:hypothetical protein
MSNIADQVHAKFKVFSGQLDPDRKIGPLAAEVAAFVRTAKVAPKSIGIEYLETAKRVILSLGYRDDEPGYQVELHCVSLGKTDALGDFSKLEQAMSAASANLRNIICHELYVTEDHEFLMVFMTHQA